MEALYRRRQATAEEVRTDLPEAPGFSAVRTMLQTLAVRGLVTRRREGRRYVYFPAVPREEAGRSAIRNMLNTYFDGSVGAALRAVLERERGRLTEAECQRLFAILDGADRELGP